MIGRLAFWRRDGAPPSRAEDCPSCRLVSGTGFLGIGTFLLVQSRRRPQPLENCTMKALAAAAGILGVALLADASFLKPNIKEPKEEQVKTVKAATKNHKFFTRR